MPHNQSMRLILANEPRAYRDVLAAAIAQLRPAIDVLDLDPADLDAAVVQLAPALVVCSRLTPTVEAQAPNWIVLYPDHGAETEIMIAGVRTTDPEPGLASLLAAIDQAQHAAQPQGM